MDIKDFLFFDKMVTPKIVNVIYWLSLVGVLVFGLVGIFSFTVAGFIQGILTIVFGALIVRIYCELIIVAFKILENLQKIAEK